ncbi:hypothetical protein [Streptomyces sp. NPDC058542]|uniref:hypothetical protein n=1 Tax=Streptomyces sp. NPDC058542 TaxID=3346543 RepID=UPI0036695B13
MKAVPEKPSAAPPQHDAVRASHHDAVHAPDLDTSAATPDLGTTTAAPDLGTTTATPDLGTTTAAPDLELAAAAPDLGLSHLSRLSHSAAPPAERTTASPPPDRRSIQRLQRMAGNGAVSRMVAQRYTAPVKPPPAQSARFRSVKADVAGKRTRLAAHAPAASESKASQDAAVAPPDDKEAQGKAANAEKMNAAKPGEFDKKAFIDAVNKAIDSQAPKNLDEADKFAKSGKADQVKAEVDGKVTDGKESSANDIDTATKAPPDTSAAKDKEVTPLTPDEAPGNPGAPSAADAVPEKQPAAVTDFSEGPAGNDKAMADAEVTEEQLAKGNEPEFNEALSAKKTSEADAAKAPAKGKAGEDQQLSTAQQNAAASGAQAMAGLTSTRAAAGKQVDGGKNDTKSKDEKKRAEVTAKLQKVYDGTKKDVEDTLSGLDKKVDSAFTSGEKSARDAFTADHKSRMKKYKDKRYSGLMGKGRWIKDKFAGLPKAANDLYQESRKLYVSRMQTVISSVADIIGAELGKAKARIAKGRTELKAEVDRLPADLKQFGEDAAKDFAGKFDDLETTVNEKSEQLVQDLAQKYTAALNKIDEEIKKLQEANKGLIDKAKDAIVGVIKTINELKNLLLGILAKAASAIMKIIKDPIGFLGNLVKAVGAGLNLFITNIADHLKTGVVSWLLGTAVKAGLDLPARFDLKGIIQLIGSMLGLTWDNIRARVTRKGVPDEAMSAVETSVPVAKNLAAEGPAGAVKEIQAETGDLKATILGKLTTYLIPTVLIAGITWIISLLNPASAFVRAVKGIIDIVTFIVTQGAQIADFVNAVLDAVIAIANGGQAGVPKLIEAALASSVPLLIGFLAALLGIGGLANKVKSVFQSVSRPVTRAIDKIVDFIARKGKALWNKRKDKKGGDQNKKDRPDVRLAARKAALRGWQDTARHTADQVVSAQQLKALLSNSAGSPNGVRITLDVVDSQNSWRVRASARSARQHARAEEGSGWIAQGDGGQRFYTAKNLSAFNSSLISETFNELGKHDEASSEDSDLRSEYRRSVETGKQIEKSQQDRLDTKVRGLKFSVEQESFTGAKQDKKVRTTVRVTPNTQSATRQVPLHEEEFPFTMGQAARTMKIESVGDPVTQLHPVKIPMKGNDPTTGYVVNMATTPGEIAPTVASRYLNEAWVGSESNEAPESRTAVVIGVNTYESLDEQKTESGKASISGAINSIDRPEKLLMAAFGFVWTPTWYKGKKKAQIDLVRKAYDGLESSEKEKVLSENEGQLRKERRLPYGLFRDEVVRSPHTTDAVGILSKVNERVHIVNQDADGGVTAWGGRGVLTEYDAFLSDMEIHPTLTIGGYTFEGFDWTPSGAPRATQLGRLVHALRSAMATAKARLTGSPTARGERAQSAHLTTLGNRLDRTIRTAISEVHPEMLYPTEPNMLIKATDSLHGGGIFQDDNLRPSPSSKQGALYGIGGSEGRSAKIRMMKNDPEGFMARYAPGTSIGTDPLPDDKGRGLTVTPQNVRDVTSGTAFDDGIPRHRAYALIMQSQTTASAMNLAREFRMINPRLTAADELRLRDEIFAHVERAAEFMVDNPDVAIEDKNSPVEGILMNLRDSFEKAILRDASTGNEELLEAYRKAHQITDRIIRTMTASEMGSLWKDLSSSLHRISESPPRSGR